jgi:hypothetical protein
MAIWHLNEIEIQSGKEMKHNKMEMFENKLHDYWNDNRKAQVYLTEDGGYGCRYYQDNIWQRDVVFDGKSELFAENAAENYVMRVFDITYN